MVNEKMIVFVGPSGVGKDTIASRVLDEHKDFRYSVSVTTRPIRPGEVEGKDYFFISKPEFDALIDGDKLIQYCTVHGNLYGTEKGNISDIQNSGFVPVLIVDVHGFDQIKKLYPYAKGIFIYPPSMDILEERLRKRGTDTEETIDRRLQAAYNEMHISFKQDYSVRVTNDDLVECVKDVLDFIDSL